MLPPKYHSESQFFKPLIRATYCAILTSQALNITTQRSLGTCLQPHSILSPKPWLSALCWDLPCDNPGLQEPAAGQHPSGLPAAQTAAEELRDMKQSSGPHLVWRGPPTGPRSTHTHQLLGLGQVGRAGVSVQN